MNAKELAEFSYRAAMATCAIGMVSDPWKLPFNVAGKSGRIDFDQVKSFMEIVGTGFVAEPGVVVTNAHVTLRVTEVHRKTNAVPAIWFVGHAFHDAEEIGKVYHSVTLATRYGANHDEDIDIGFLTYDHSKVHTIHRPMPLASHQPSPGETLMMAGFPYGSLMLDHGAGGLSRIGPLLTYGRLAGKAPHINTAYPTEYIADIRSAPGSSGSPLISIDQGGVVGVHYAATQDLAFYSPGNLKAVIASVLDDGDKRLAEPLGQVLGDLFSVGIVRRGSPFARAIPFGVTELEEIWQAIPQSEWPDHRKL